MVVLTLCLFVCLMRFALFYKAEYGGGYNFASLTNQNYRKMEQQENKPAVTADDAVLQFLAEEHPADEGALEELTGLLSEGTDSRRLIATLYAGLRHDSDVEAADVAGYLRGKNEAIERERLAESRRMPHDDGGHPAGDIPLLRHIRRSVWD